MVRQVHVFSIDFNDQDKNRCVFFVTVLYALAHLHTECSLIVFIMHHFAAAPPASCDPARKSNLEGVVQ